jgi:hypothetical protein
VIGDSEPSQQLKNEVGGEAQSNQCHYVELIAALAALDFSARGGERQEQQLPAFRISAVQGSNLQWADLPMDGASLERLIGGFVSAHTFLTMFRPDGNASPELDRRVRASTWTQYLGLSTKTMQERTALLDDMGKFFHRTWKWAGELGAASPSLSFVQRPGDQPSKLRHDESIAGRRPPRQMRNTSDDGNEIFRHWNTASVRHAKAGFKGFLSVMREGSESFAQERFSETFDVK